VRRASPAFYSALNAGATLALWFAQHFAWQVWPATSSTRNGIQAVCPVELVNDPTSISGHSDRGAPMERDLFEMECACTHVFRVLDVVRAMEFELSQARPNLAMVLRTFIRRASDAKWFRRAVALKCDKDCLVFFLLIQFLHSFSYSDGLHTSFHLTTSGDIRFCLGTRFV